jgi:hypothetical protein
MLKSLIIESKRLQISNFLGYIKALFPFNNLDLLIGEVLELIDEATDITVGGDR